MFCIDSFLNAVVTDVSATTTTPAEDDDCKKRIISRDNTVDDDVLHQDTAVHSSLSKRQRQKLKRKLKKQQAIKLNGRQKARNIDQSLRLHQFVSTCFRSELNIAENGCGHFIQNAPKVSAHHAILNGLVRVNGIVTMVGSKILEFGDVVSLEIDESSLFTATGKLISWKGSEDVAEKLEDQRDYGERKGRMSISIESSPFAADVDHNTISKLPFIQYYRTKLGGWVPSIHEVAIMKPLPVTLRVLKRSKRLEDELHEFGFRPVKESDANFQLRHNVTEENGGVMQQQQQMKPIDPSIMKEFMSNTWIMDQEQSSTAGRKSQLGVFLSEARISGEILQQELNSMMPVSILVSILKKKMAKDSSIISSTRPMRFLDLCAAPGSKTCQLITALDSILGGNRDDFVIIANELNPSRAMQLRQRCFQQCGSRSLSHLLVTNFDGRDFEKVEEGVFDFIICDVPCSGDGTIRRSPDLLSKWSTKNAEKNKPVQKGLLKVALERLRPGGVCLYSTCSLNPVENDEVVEETLQELNTSSNHEYSLLSLEGNSEGSGSLQILPDASHGGFFVAAIHRKELASVDTTSNEVNHDGVEIVWKNNLSNKTGVAYAISSCTKNLSAHVSDRLGHPLSSGVPVMYKTKDETSPIILQDGCAALNALGSYDTHFGYSVVQLSKSQLCEYTSANNKTLCIPMKLFIHINTETTALIIRVNNDAVSTSKAALTLLPAKIIHKQQNHDGTGSDDVIYEVEIIARPQILKRSICGN